MKSPLVAIGALVLVAGGAVAGYGVTRKATGGLTPQASEAMGSSIAQLDGDVKTARLVVKERANTLATIQTTSVAIGTDKGTAKDQLEGGELQFQPQTGEVVEIGQIAKKDNKREVLLVQPVGGMINSHNGIVGSYADLMGDKALIVEVAAVTSKYKPDEYTGYVAVSRPLDLKPSIDRLMAAGVTGTLHIAQEKMMIGTPPANAETREMVLPSLPDVKLVAAVPAKSGGMNMPLAAGGSGVAADAPAGPLPDKFGGKRG